MAEPLDVPLQLDPALIESTRTKVDDLTRTLNEEGLKTAAASILRGLLSEIRLIPEEDGLAIELVGELAAILALGNALQTGTPAAMLRAVLHFWLRE